jgi:glycosyltransferase involved in cell wall biosynthesis
MRKRLVYIVSSIEKSLAFEWVVDGLDLTKYELTFVILGKESTALAAFLRQREVTVYEIPYQDSKNFFTAFKQTLGVLRKIDPEIVHAHLFDAGRIGITAAWLLRIKKRIYTRHYSTFHHDYFPKAVFFDRLINLLSTRIVAISQVVKRVLVEHERVPVHKTVMIPHGFDFGYFIHNASEVSAMRKKWLKGEDNGPVIGVISRYNELKGIQYTIDAFVKLKKLYPSAHLVLANAQGDYKNILQLKLRGLPDNAYTEIVFEENVRALYGMFDVFVHVPIGPASEAFGQTYVEALAMQVPSVFTMSGIAGEFIVDEFNALVVEYKNAGQIFNACCRLLEDPVLAQKLKTNGVRSVSEKFQIAGMIQNLDTLYQ